MPAQSPRLAVRTGQQVYVPVGRADDRLQPAVGDPDDRRRPAPVRPTAPATRSRSRAAAVSTRSPLVRRPARPARPRSRPAVGHPAPRCPTPYPTRPPQLVSRGPAGQAALLAGWAVIPTRCTRRVPCPVKGGTYRRRRNTVPVWTTPAARIAATCPARNARQVCSDRLGTGSMPASLEVCRAADGATSWPSPVTGMRRYPHTGCPAPSPEGSAAPGPRRHASAAGPAGRRSGGSWRSRPPGSSRAAPPGPPGLPGQPQRLHLALEYGNLVAHQRISASLALPPRGEHSQPDKQSTGR